jgi:hypothetical protein
MNINKLAIEELAIAMLKVKDDDDIDEALDAAYGVDLRTYTDIVKPIIQKLTMGISPMTQRVFVGISTGDHWDIKVDRTNEFIGTVVKWATECEGIPKTGEGFQKIITAGGKATARICITDAKTEVKIK